jgi:hypothetical protein
MECSGTKYEVKFYMKDNYTIVCEGIDKIHKKNSKVKCELTIDDELILTDRGIHTCMLIKNEEIKIHKIFKVSLSSTEIEKMYKYGNDLFSKQNIKDILDNKKELHRILKRLEIKKENEQEMRLRVFIETRTILEKQHMMLQREHDFVEQYQNLNLDTNYQNQNIDKEYYTDIPIHHAEYIVKIKEDLDETENQLFQLNEQINALYREIQENQYNEYPVQEDYFEPQDSIVVIGKQQNGLYRIIFLNLDPTKPWNQDWRTINFWATNKELAKKEYKRKIEELEQLENKYKDYKWVRSKSKSKMYRILLYQKEHKLKQLETELKETYGILENSVYYAEPHKLSIEPVDTPIRTPSRGTRRSIPRESRRSTRRDSHRSIPRESRRSTRRDSYQDLVMKSIETSENSRIPTPNRKTRKFRFSNLFNIFKR